jgi:hypothetical protein
VSKSESSVDKSAKHNSQSINMSKKIEEVKKEQDAPLQRSLHSKDFDNPCNSDSRKSELLEQPKSQPNVDHRFKDGKIKFFDENLINQMAQINSQVKSIKPLKLND